MTTRTIQLQVTLNAQGHVIAETFRNGCRTQERILSLSHIRDLLVTQQAEINAAEKAAEEKRIAAARAQAREVHKGIVATHGKIFADRVMAYQVAHKNGQTKEPTLSTAKGLGINNVEFD